MSAAEEAAVDPSLDGGSYEVIRSRLTEQAQELQRRTDALNEARQAEFGSTRLELVGHARVRTEHNCVPRDILQVQGKLLFGFNVFLGLKTEVSVEDVFVLHGLESEGTELHPAASDSLPGLLDAPSFRREFGELFQYYKDTRLLQLRQLEAGRILAVFQTGGTLQDVKAFRWGLAGEELRYVDNRGEREHVFPSRHDFEWRRTTRDDQVAGRHPHVSILDEVFIETVGGDLTVKIEDNTEDGRGIYSEPVEDPRQSLDDAEIRWAKVGALILLEVLPYQERQRRYLVFNTRTKTVHRVDAIGQACVQLPEDHGIIFPGGYLLENGEAKTFDTVTEDLIFVRKLRAPNGEDVLYVFHHQKDGRYLLLPYNLIRKEVATPLEVNGFSIFDDGRMIVLKAQPEATRVHPLQIWHTPFSSDEYAARQPSREGFLAKVGNDELVRGISEALSIVRLALAAEPRRETFEDLIKAIERARDAYYWLDREEVGDLAGILAKMLQNAELVIDEFEKVQTLSARAKEVLSEAASEQAALVKDLRPQDWREVSAFLEAMDALRRQQGHLISLEEVRYLDRDRLSRLQEELGQRLDDVSRGCVRFLLQQQAMAPLLRQIDELIRDVEAAEKVLALQPAKARLERLGEGLNVLSEVVAGLEIEDSQERTQILERISEVLSALNRARAISSNRRKELASSEGRAEFSAQFKLLGQAVSSALALADTPEACDSQLSRVLIQMEELETRFGEFDVFLEDLAARREEIYEAFNGKKQELLDARQRKAGNLASAAERILDGMRRRAQSFDEEDALNAYFASDPMIAKLRQLVESLRKLEEGVRADDLEAKAKALRREALRTLHDKGELFENGEDLIRLGRHRFTVNRRPFELTMVPKDGDMYFHVTGTAFHEKVDDNAFERTRGFWDEPLVSEDREVYRSEYLAARVLFEAEAEGASGLEALVSAGGWEGLLKIIRERTAQSYEEGYERGLHDLDAARILEQLVALHQGAGLLRFPPGARGLAALWWAHGETAERERLHRRASSLGRLRSSLGGNRSISERRLAEDLELALRRFVDAHELRLPGDPVLDAGRYLVEEMIAAHPRFVVNREAVELVRRLEEHLDLDGGRRAFEEDLSSIERLGERLGLALAWIDAFVERHDPDAHPLRLEAAAVLLAPRVDRQESTAPTTARVEGLLGQHPRIQDRSLELRLDEFGQRLHTFMEARVPDYRAYRSLRHELLERERRALRLDALQPRILSSFVRNRLIDEVYLPIIGDNLAKQLGAAGDAKRTDLMGLLLLVSPPGYGKTTLVEYVANRLGMVFMKINGPALGHQVSSLDPEDASNATARQEVERVNFAFEMSDNVMLYVDDIQHTNPEFLQKFISLCDGQRRIEGVWRGRSKAYDLRGKKFAVVMAGNPYTESGEKFQIPDMLANRADTYNLGDVLTGRDEAFASSYIENSITSNPSLSPVVARSMKDMRAFIRMSAGEEVSSTEFERSHAQVEIEEILVVLRHLRRIQSVLLAVNLQYIESASQDDRYRTEPPFKLQGSYRNMNRLAEKVVAAMTDEEIEVLITDHYESESQTLTTGAEQNLLKLAEMRGRMSESQAARWNQIKADFRRSTLQGGDDEDPVVRVTSSLSGLGAQLEGIRAALEAESSDRTADGANGDLEVVLRTHLATLEKAILPLAQSSVEHLEQARALGTPLRELIELLRWNAISRAEAKKP
ncbi:MAG: DNA repair ATPase [Myxococcota bacterium]